MSGFSVFVYPSGTTRAIPHVVIARHEAAHALMYRVLGGRATLCRAIGQGRHLPLTRGHGPLSGLAASVVGHAGPAADELFGAQVDDWHRSRWPSRRTTRSTSCRRFGRGIWSSTTPERSNACVSPPAGTWIRDGARKWHRFGGDMVWWPAWDLARPIVHGDYVFPDHMERSETMPATDVCRRCAPQPA